MLLRHCSLVLGIAILLTMAGVAPAAIFTGKLATESGVGVDGLLTGVGTVWGSGSAVTWTVDTGYAPGQVSYSYTLTVASGQGGGISHVNLETSQNFTVDDLLTTNWPAGDLEIGYLKVNPGSASMPSGINGIKFDDSPDVRSLTINFTSTRMPVWGDFYAKGGLSNELWNVGFGTAAQEADTTSTYYDASDPAATPYEAPHSGSYSNHLLVPDTTSVVSSQLRVFKFRDDDGDGEWGEATEPLLPLPNDPAWWFKTDGTGYSATLPTAGSPPVADFGNRDNGEYKITELGLQVGTGIYALPPGWWMTGVQVFDDLGNPVSPLEVNLAEHWARINLNEPLDVYFGNIPEPATLAFVGIGGLMLLLRRRSRR